MAEHSGFALVLPVVPGAFPGAHVRPPGGAIPRFGFCSPPTGLGRLSDGPAPMVGVAFSGQQKSISQLPSPPAMRGLMLVPNLQEPAHTADRISTPASSSSKVVVVPERLRDTQAHEANSRGGRVSDRNVRRLNVAVAAAGILLTVPIMILIAIALRLTSPGPILYRQERVGHNRRRYRGHGSENRRRSRNAGGRIFTMYKFRTMHTEEVEASPRAVWACQGDPRITPVGAFLRQHRLDELPQLFNVLRGDMNVVGPRPEQPEIFQELRSRVEAYPERQAVLPGITGWAQINCGYDQSLDDVRRKVALDLEYIHRRSPGEDLRIMVRTVPVMFGARGSL